LYKRILEIYRKFTLSSLTLERHTIHIADDTGRIAMVENLIIGNDGSEPTLTRNIYSNHLQSSSLELDDAANVITYEEYHPFGTTSYHAKNTSINAIAKRYRYTGKERDEESGLYYHGARYYIPWLCRWSAVDPLESKYAGLSSYNYSFNNPVMFNDPSGMGPGDYKYIPPTSNTMGEKPILPTAQGTPSAGSSIPVFKSNTAGVPDRPAPPSAPKKANQAQAINKKYKSAKSALKTAINWEQTKALHPIEAGVTAGALHFVESTLEGVATIVAHPINTVQNLAQTYMYLQPGGIALPGGVAFFNGLENLCVTTCDNFKNGDVYTKSAMGTEAVLTVASFFVGTGEAKGASAGSKLGALINEVERGVVTGEKAAATITQGGTGRAFAGHGEILDDMSFVTIPENTSLTFWVGEGEKISDPLAKLIEQGNYIEAVSNPAFLAEINTGAVTHLSGSVIPNAILTKPSNLNIMSNSMTVLEETRIGELLNVNKGKRLDWAACLWFNN
jgi:RHS repeat-associated protein